MPTLKLGEVVVDAVLAKLQAGYANRVSEINAEKADAIVISAPDPSDFYFAGVSELPRAPAVIVTQLPTDGEHEPEGPHSFTWSGDIAVVAYDTDTDRSHLARRLQRHVRAIVEILWDDAPQEGLAGSAFYVKFVRDDPGPVSSAQDTGSVWSGMHVAVFRCSQAEN